MLTFTLVFLLSEFFYPSEEDRRGRGPDNTCTVCIYMMRAMIRTTQRDSRNETGHQRLRRTKFKSMFFNALLVKKTLFTEKYLTLKQQSLLLVYSPVLCI